jgi:hypothetical protein
MARLPCDNPQGFFWKVTVTGLNILEDGNEPSPIMIMTLDDPFDVFWVHRFCLSGKRVRSVMVFSSILFAVPDPALEFRKSACLTFFTSAAETPRFERLEPSRNRFIRHTSWRNWRNVPDEGSSFGRWGKDAVELFALQHRMVRSFGIGTSRSFLAARTEALIHTLLKG